MKKLNRVALLFAVTSSQLLLPNPLMPYDVRMAHLLETVTSNFLFGWLVVVILRSDGTDSSPTVKEGSDVAHRALPHGRATASHFVVTEMV